MCDIILYKIWPKFGWSLFWWFKTVHQDKLSRKLAAPRKFANTIPEWRTKTFFEVYKRGIYCERITHTIPKKDTCHLKTTSQDPISSQWITSFGNKYRFVLTSNTVKPTICHVCLQHVSMFSKDVLYTVSIQPRAWPNLNKFVIDHGHCHKCTFFF